MLPSLTRRQIVLIFIVTVVVAVWAGVTRARRESDRAALRLIYEAIQTGDSRATVAEVCSRYRTKTITLDDRDDRLWIIAMPLEFGATNWQVFVDFTGDKLTGLRMRTADGPPLRGGPPDKSSQVGTD